MAAPPSPSLPRTRIPGLEVGRGLDELPWRETKVAGVSWLPLALDETDPDPAATGERARGGGCVLIRMAPGQGYPPHRHLGAEDVLVLQGGYRDASGEYLQGDHVRYPPGSVHAPVALGDPTAPEGPANPACILYATLSVGLELVDATSAPGARTSLPPNR